MSPTIPAPGHRFRALRGHETDPGSAADAPREHGRVAGDDDRVLDRQATFALSGLVALMVAALLVLAAVTFADRPAAAPSVAAPPGEATATPPDNGHGPPAGVAPAPADGDEPVERYQRPDPDLPAVPEGQVKRFRVDVYEHVTRVSETLPATRVWSYAINGKLNRGTGVSEPMVVNEGDDVEITLVNGEQKEMHVQFPHSIDYHSSEVAPNEAFKTIGPGKRHTFRFKAKHPGVFMYHCATAPVLLHTGAGMAGMMVVKPRDLAPVDRELWITQQEYYLGPRDGDNADLGKMNAKRPDVIAFNGYADQYAKRPIEVEAGERIRMYVLNAGPSIWSAFHVIGTVFDRTVIEGTVGRHAQTVNLAPSQGGWVEFTLEEDGAYPFVTHAFGDMVKGATGVLAAGDAPQGAGH